MKNKLFPDLSPVTEGDRTRLSYHLSGYNRLAAILTLGTLTKEDLQKMIVIEAEGQKRPVVLDKLAGRLLTVHRGALKVKILAYVQAQV
jgi:hypothetical protein|tara:strand:- start:174 stop:440 length:267 start_codon:yes stop_codon:yes gene_type:complete